MPEDQAIDLKSIETLRSLTDDGGVFLRELIDIYLQDTPLRLTELEQAFAKQDAPAFIRAAHTIKGSSGNFGAARLARLAQEIELLGKAGTLPAAAAACAQLKTEYALVAEALVKVARET
jgi:HPt (histidine-containing phosphotransfer) domain-containing protein